MGAMAEKTAPDIGLKTFLPAGYPVPVAVSVPFAQGQIKSVEGVSLTSDGKALPQQWAILSKWPDGSVRWAQAICPPMEPLALRMDKSARAPIQPELNITESPEGITVKTGAATLTVTKQTAIARLESKGRSLSFLLSEVTTSDGSKLPAHIDSLSVFESGPMRTVIRATGMHQSEKKKSGFLSFDVLLTLYAGTSVVEVDHTLGIISGSLEENKTNEMIFFRSATIPVQLEKGNATVLDGEKTWTPLLAGQRMFQWEDFAWAVEKGSDVTGKGARAGGVLTVATPAGVCFAAVRDFWQQYPKAFSVSTEGFTVDLFPDLTLEGKNPYANRKDEQIWYFYLRTGQYELRQGVQKSHRLFLGWSDTVEAAQKQGVALGTLPVVLPPLAYTQATKVEGEMLTPMSGGLFSDWDQAFIDASNSYFSQQVENRWYGLLNWGDWYGERRYNWCNHEYDLPANFFRQALRFENPDYFREAVREATHRMDVDVVHQHWDVSRNGINWKHSVGHTGGYYKPGSFHLSNYGDSDAIFMEGSSTPGHTRVAGFFLDYLLTGNPRARETGCLVADHLLRTDLLTKKNYSYITAREPGWSMTSLTAAYHATLEPRYLNGANYLADLVIKKAEGNGVWLRPLKSHQTGTDVTKGEVSFTTAFQGAGMIEVYKITKREDVKQNILKTSQYIVNNFYRPEFKAFVHSPSRDRSQSPRAGGLTGSNLRYVMAYAYDLGHDPALIDPIRDSFASTVANRQWCGTKQDPNRPYPHDISSSFYWLNQEESAMDRILGKELRTEKEKILSRAAPASVFPQNTKRWEEEKVGTD